MTVSCAPSNPATLGVPQGEEREPQKPAAESFTLPAKPLVGDLLAFRVSSLSDAQYFVDTRSIDAARDGIVRATIIARRSGVGDAVSYEGFRCAARERRVYAYGRVDGTWQTAKPSEWRRMPAVSGADYGSTLYRDFFCPRGVPIGSAREGVNALRRGLHPDLAN